MDIEVILHCTVVWRLSIVLLVVHTALVHTITDTSCREENGCTHTNNTRGTSSEHCPVPGSNLLRVGESLFHTTEIMHGTEALDLCLVVSTSSSMSGSQLWLQMAVPVLDGHLLSLSIGMGERANRYCLVMFGGNIITRFVRVNGEIFFPYNQFFQARRQLVRTAGSLADGYEAINFTMNNAPFREHPNVAKVIVLVTDSDRGRPTVHSDLTQDTMRQSLHSRHIMLDTVVSISLQLAGVRDGVVLGFHGYRKASLLQPDGGYRMSHNQSVHVTQAAGQTISDYVTLSLSLDSSSWPLGLLNNEDYDTIVSFANAFTNSHDLYPALPTEVCQQCRCGPDLQLSCYQPVNQDQCRCLVEGSSSECGALLPSPTPTSISYSTPTTTPEPVTMEIEGHVTTMHNGDTVVSFTSNHHLAIYQCIFMPDRIETPLINTCTSPYQMSTPTPGRYSLLVMGRHEGQVASRLLWFEVLPRSGRLDVTAIQRNITPNASVLVEFAANRLDVEFQCTTGDVPFRRCTSPYLIPPKAPGLHEDVFIVLATDTNGKGAASVLKIDDPTMSPPTTEAPDPVMIEVWTKLPDAEGVIRICFSATRNDVTCICTIGVQGPIICFNRTTGRGEYSASPDELGTGPHTLEVTCMDDDAFSTSERVKFNLAEPPLAPPPTESLHCNLSLAGPNDRGILLATHDCSRPVTSLCRVSRLPATPCGTHFEFNTSPLGPGNHVFVLVAEDGFGESITKVFPFFIETAQRRCCPEIVHNLTSVSVERDLLVHLHLGVNPGNCSLNEGFSYSINWGDAASESGTKTHLSDVYSYRQYSTEGHYTINAAYCNNPAANEDTCCSSVVLSVDLLDSSQQT